MKKIMTYEFWYKMVITTLLTLAICIACMVIPFLIASVVATFPAEMIATAFVYIAVVDMMAITISATFYQNHPVKNSYF